MTISAPTTAPGIPDLGPRFELSEAVGEGRGGTVWRARDLVRGRDVAIKLLPVGADGQEFRTLRLLQHPGIVPVLDTGRTRSGRLWFSMEFVEGLPFGGEGCRQLLPRSWAQLVVRLLEAIAFVHDRGWVHGDLKPANILASPQKGRLRVLDFGLSIRGAGGLRGSRGFIAPELLEGGEATHASDLYSVGVLAWLGLTGTPPFPPDAPQPGLGPRELLTPGLAEGSEPLPEPLLRWLNSLLRRDPALRPKDGGEALSGLLAIVGDALRNPDDAVARIAPTEPIGRATELEDLRSRFERGARVVIAGPSGAGRTFLLEEVRQRLTAAGSEVEFLQLGADPEFAWRALTAATAEFGHQLPPPPPGLADDPAERARERLAIHDAQAVETVRRALRSSERVWLVDDPDEETRAGVVLLTALAAEPAVQAIVTAEDRRRTSVLDVLGAGHREPALIQLRPWRPEDVVRWLEAALGPVHEAAELATALLSHRGGLPAHVIDATGSLLRRGALFRGENSWAWGSSTISEDLDVEPTVRVLPTVLTPERLLAETLVVARRRVARGELRAARTVLRSALEGPSTPLRGATHNLVSPLWSLRAQVHELLAEFADAAACYGKLREGPDSPPELLVAQARCLREASRHGEALELLAALPMFVPPDVRFDLHREKASCLQALGEYEGAREVAEQWLEDAPSTFSEKHAAMGVVLANCDWNQGFPDRADHRCRELLRKVDPAWKRAHASIVTTRGTALWRLGRLDEAAVAMTKGGRLFEESGSLLDAARVANNLALLRYAASDWSAAIDSFERFRRLVERLGHAGETASALNNLGVLYRDTGQIDRAKAALDRALVLARRHGLVRLEAMTLGNLGELAAIGARRELAEERYTQAISLAREHGIVDEQTECWRRVVQRRLDDRELNSVARPLAEARRCAEETGDESETNLLDALTGVVRVRQGEVDAGADQADEAINRLVDAGSLHEAARMRLRLSEALADAGRYNDAADLLDVAEITLRSLRARPELLRVEPLRQYITAASRNRFDQLASHYEALQDLTLALSRETDLGALLETILARTLELVGFDRGYVVLLDDGGAPSLQATREVSAEEVENAVRGPSTSVTGRVLRTRRPLVSLDIADDDSLGRHASVEGGRLRSVICVPILRGEQLLGVIYVDSRTTRGGATEEKAALLGACADAASVAIENARLVEALRRKNDSLAILAHELRTPLNAMIGLASEALNTEEGLEGVRSLVAHMKTQGERMSTMINQVLTVARMEAGQAEWRRDPVDPLELVVSARDTMTPLAAQAEVKLEADVTEDAPEVLGDLDRLIQVIVNLAGNAIKFVPVGGTVWIVASRDLDGWLLLEVSDNGPGIAEERLRSIFEPYQQAGDPGMRQLGVGLGLAISRTIVSEHGGSLTATNREEGGACFSLRLPPAEKGPEP